MKESETEPNDLNKNQILLTFKIVKDVLHDISNIMSSLNLKILRLEHIIERNGVHDTEIILQLIREMKIPAISLGESILLIRNILNPIYSNTEKFDLIEIINECINNFEMHFKKMKINCVLYVDKKTYIINGNIGIFSLMIMNLIKNSIESFAGKIITNRIIKINVTKNKTMISISVYDNGIGILSENVNHIFDPYFTTKNYGTGLGLSIIKSFVENEYNGSIKVESSFGDGTIVYLQLNVSDD